VKAPRRYLLRGRILLQGVSAREIRSADLVIIVQANGYMLNYPLLLAAATGLKRVAFWGHGYNHQTTSTALSERFRRLLVNVPQWWFAYTERTAAFLRDNGVAANKITVINNAIDTSGFERQVAAVSEADIAGLRARFDIPQSARVGLYCGSLYPNKHLPFMIDAATRIRAQIPDFLLVIVGAGPDVQFVERAAAEHPWVRYLGPQFGGTKAAIFRISEVFLNPGLVGLAILDTFAGAVPIVTTDVPVHSPEIAYLNSGVNGLIVKNDAAVYAQAVVELLRDPRRLGELRQGALLAARQFSLENMVRNVAGGVVACLEAAGLKPAPDGVS
jgi:glycosyltransferase involved in cell wall biosynthesis